jgi:23S rRNA (uracil1939-C5)-methyltransferase
MRETVTVETIGHRGDGVVTTPDGPLYVPFTLPGETVAVERDGNRARIVEILAPSPERVTPICKHFGTCGGCSLQMMSLEATRQLKRDFVVKALAQRRLDAVPVEEPAALPPDTRRRTVLTALRAGGRLILGYHQRLSHAVVDIEECPILVPRLQARLADIRALVAPLVTGRKLARITVLHTSVGLDIDIAGVPPPSAKVIAELAQGAEAHGLARLSVEREPVLTLAEPLLDMGVAMTPPPGGFVQASAEAQAAMMAPVTIHLAGARRIADLFAGVGPFTLAFAPDARVHAFESDPRALAALQQAARRTPGLKPVKTEVRDLFAHPLSPEELNAYDAVIFDPPRAGAKAIAEALAASTVRSVAAVSCNPATFARDARILVEGGYRSAHVVPVDQFVYSAETEVVGIFSRGDAHSGRAAGSAST